jgi:hypothetical protein
MGCAWGRQGEDRKNAYWTSARKCLIKRPFTRPRRRWKDNIKTDEERRKLMIM